MVGSNGNDPGVIGLVNIREGFGVGGRKFAVGMGHNRRALSNINRNIIGALPNTRVVSKRAFPEKFAAQIANKQQQLDPEKFKKPVQLVSNSSESEDHNRIDGDNNKAASHDSPVPMFIQHTEAMMDEIDRMKVEMEDVDEEPVVEIDSSDKRNPLAAVEYIDDLYNFYRKAEISSCVPPNYMAQQSDINEKMRGILIDWLIEVHYKFELMDETLYLTVNLIDRFLAVQEVARKTLQLAGVTAMLLACKYEEVSVPVMEDLTLISDKAYSRKEVLEMEKLMVNTLCFNMSVPTPYVFMRRFLKAAQSDKKLELLSFFIIELCLVEYQMLKFPPSMLAAAAIYTAQYTLSGYTQWSKTHECHTSYTEQLLMECSRLMIMFHQNAETGRLTGAYRKYSTSKLGYTAKSKPIEHRF